MKLLIPLVVFLVATLIQEATPQRPRNRQALFIKNDILRKGKSRVTRQTSSDQMVQNILQWLQGVYTQNTRRIRQGTLREYLPPSQTQKPRPFQPAYTTSDNNDGYPASGFKPQPPFPYPTVPGQDGYPQTNEVIPGEPSKAPATGYPEGTSSTFAQQSTTTSGFSTDRPGVSTASPAGYTTSQPGYTTPQPAYTTGYSTSTTGYTSSQSSEAVTTQQPGVPSVDYSTLSPQGFTSTTEGPTPGYSTPQPEYPTNQGFSTSPPVEVSPEAFPTYSPNVEDGSITTGAPITIGPSTGAPFTTGPSTSAPITSAPSETIREELTSPAAETTESPEVNEIPTAKTDTGDNTGTGSDIDEDLKHPPHIHEINVDCGKEMMTINIEFNRQFDGIIYSKGFYSNPDCRYVQENSGQTKYSFTVSLNTCGTEFVNAFDTEGKSYLQNVLVVQNEAGIQEVWDVIRSVRCLWEGSLKDTLSVNLSVGMLTQEIVTFSGDTAMAKLDIQLGKGPFAPAADGLVKIGETMTLVVSVSGDPGFDLQVKDCRATDSTSENVVPLTDENGCVLKPKLFGAFQKTRNTGDTGASIMAYAFFNAFKFPDVMDLMIECNIELCKTDCEVCPNSDQKIEPGRRRKRDLQYYNSTLSDGVTMGKLMRVILPEDIQEAQAFVSLSHSDGVCMSTQSFVFSTALLLSLLVASCLFSAFMWLQNQRLAFLKH
ncbi:unnamed protein product [Brassicogethes aeneus]|uniref:ZP domain-containing protein n=1 Tax=Brassicogethes aeneus TaxID=1431903 RepID=A0A9P0AX15_BRAAE|nr:unnamed protein product [Brassicogethes aeneus]